MSFKTRYRIVRNEYGYDAQYRKWWNPFWLPCMSGKDEFTRSQFTFADAQKLCDAHYEGERMNFTVCYYNPSDSSVKYE